MRRLLILSALAASPACFAADPPKVALKDGDRVVYLGNAFAEQDQSHGYLETLLTITHPDIDFTFRNLGWSGDTVWGDARARFGTRADGFAHLKAHVLALEPTVLLVAYGMNESFAGEAGLKEFESGLNTLLDALAETKAQIILIAPIPHQALGPPLPDPAAHNADLALYRDAIARAAGARGLGFVDLMDVNGVLGTRGRVRLPIVTSDGIHPTGEGYRFLDYAIARAGFAPRHFEGAPKISRDDRGNITMSGILRATEAHVTPNSIRFEGVSDLLPYPVGPAGSKEMLLSGSGVSIDRLNPGKYAWSVDDRVCARFEIVDRKPYPPLIVREGPDFDQVERLRALINKKNQLYFYRWRPQNETYLFGFRKHEQGNNAVEIPKFDPLIAELEAQIHVIKKPVKHTYELIREPEG